MLYFGARAKRALRPEADLENGGEKRCQKPASSVSAIAQSHADMRTFWFRYCLSLGLRIWLRHSDPEKGNAYWIWRRVPVSLRTCCRKRLARTVVVGMDMNAEMLDVAARRSKPQTNLSFKACPAENLDSSDDAFDCVVCQQGFQFFTDKHTAAKQIRRVLRKSGTAIVSVWRPTSECEFFSAISDALRAIDENEIAELIRAPFDFMPRPTPIGPRLRALTAAAQAQFTETLASLAERLGNDGITMGRMASDVLVATK